MNDLIPYLFQSALTLIVLYAIYWLFLRRDTFFLINRFYLLLTLFLSVILPLFHIHLQSDNPVAPVFILLAQVTITPEKLGQVSSGDLSWLETAGVIYFTGVAIFTFRFLVRLIQLMLIVSRNRISHQEGMNIVFVDKGYAPFSFFNLVFIRKEYFDDGNRSPVLIHENVHIRQYHTLDLLIFEIVAIVQWFNPFAWFLGRSLKGTHEFLADQGVLNEGFHKNEYRTLILDKTMGLRLNILTNNFNVSLLKNRITMMTKSRSGRWAVSKLLITLPAIACLLFFFSAGTPEKVFSQVNKNNDSKSSGPATTTAVPQSQDKAADPAKAPVSAKSASGDTIYSVAEVEPSFPGGEAALIDFMIKNVKYPEEAKKKGIQGKVFVIFVVEKDGKVTNVKVKRGIGGGCDEEAARVIKMMPKWNPGSDKGKTVRVQFILPIAFSLKEKADKQP